MYQDACRSYLMDMKPPTPQPSTLMHAVAAELRAVKAARQLDYHEIERASGVSTRSLMRYFNAQRDLGVSDLKGICVALGVDPAQVIRRATLRQREAQEAAAAYARSIVGDALDDLPEANGSGNGTNGSTQHHAG